MPRIYRATSELSAAQRVCGHRWSDGKDCSGSEEHMCWRSSPEHRSHMCTCEAVRLDADVTPPYAAAS